jgi:hypothetical protein
MPADHILRKWRAGARFNLIHLHICSLKSSCPFSHPLYHSLFINYLNSPIYLPPSLPPSLSLYCLPCLPLYLHLLFFSTASLSFSAPLSFSTALCSPPDDAFKKAIAMDTTNTWTQGELLSLQLPLHVLLSIA